MKEERKFNLIKTCQPTSCILVILSCLTIFCCSYVIPNPNPLQLNEWAQNPTLKFMWNFSPITLITIANHTWLKLVISCFFECSFKPLAQLE